MEFVFIAHAPADSEAAHRIAAALERRGLKAWYAQRDAPGAAPALSVVHDAIARSWLAVLILSTASDCDEIQQQTQVALASGVPIIVFALDPDARLSVTDPAFRRYICIDVGERLGSAIRPLLTAVRYEQRRKFQSEAVSELFSPNLSRSRDRADSMDAHDALPEARSVDDNDVSFDRLRGMRAHRDIRARYDIREPIVVALPAPPFDTEPATPQDLHAEISPPVSTSDAPPSERPPAQLMLGEASPRYAAADADSATDDAAPAQHDAIRRRPDRLHLDEMRATHAALRSPLSRVPAAAAGAVGSSAAAGLAATAAAGAAIAAAPVLAVSALIGGFFGTMFRRWLSEPEIQLSANAASPASAAAAPDAQASNPTPPRGDSVDVSAFAPDAVAPDAEFLVQVLLYDTAADAAEIRALAQRADPDAALRGARTLRIDVPRGTHLTIAVDSDTVEWRDPPLQTVTWSGETRTVQFLAALPRTCVGTAAHVRVRVLKDAIPVAQLRFALRMTEGAMTKPRAVGDEAQVFRRAFLSYCRADSLEVLKRAQAVRAVGIELFQDFTSIRPGERWADRIYDEIDRSDLFLLFWSEAAKGSTWVGYEIDRALTAQERSRGRRPQIVPVLLEGPPPPQPPPRLKDIHFDDAYSYFIAAASLRTAPRAS